ncbi:hypothetical protein [Nocardioides sp. AX2bis]|uniref:hypothetical protein n=1 Tax=Nocardioides sp. AX2bis TaxID=2653157 RepID=UPI0012F16085|nr:hypothetical protein [Nocardioides sp. AX2bis]VXB08015.1 conserved hypothetical protein [Nocardioides sp. AX2bis]
MSTYTDRKVHRPFADKLGTGSPLSGHAVRFSVIGDAGGIAAQRAAHFSIYGDNPAIAKISAFPDDAWDPSSPEVGAKYGISWITMADLHHTARGTDPIAAVVCVDGVVFLNITLSSTLKHISRQDGEDLNGVTVMIMALLNHFPSLREMCWADDVTRAGRDKADWTQITTKCKHRDIALVFGGQRYDQRNPGDELALGALGLVGGNDDPNRRRKLTGKRLMKCKLGGAAISEMQMPHGWHQKKDRHGRPVNEGDRGLIPEANPAMIPVFGALYDAGAAGESYQVIAERMVAFEADGRLRRRDHTNLDNTYAQTVDDPLARYDAAKSFFVRSSFRPRIAPSEQDIARYLAGEDPADVFDADTRLYIAKVELLRTGRYFRRLRNDIRGRNIVLDGIPATYRDDRDEYGWFDILSAPWAWPTDDAGREVPRFGLSDDTCRKVAARLLGELRAPKAATGGQAHRTSTRRVLRGFTNWTVQPAEAGSKYDDEPTQWGVEARNNLSGRANFILLFRRESAGAGPRTGRGWSYFGPGESKPAHIAATGSLAELAASVATHLDRAVRSLADLGSISTLTELPAEEQTYDQTATWEHRIDLKRTELTQLEAEAKGHRTMAALAAGAGDDDEAKAYAAQASEVRTRVRDVEAEIARIAAKVQAHRDQQRASTAHDDQADVSVAAYLVAGLEGSARRNGEAPARLGRLCDETFTDWRLRPDGEDLAWTCAALLPLSSGGHARLPLAGTIRNVRTRTGKTLANAETVVRYVFEEGRDLTEVADLLQVTRKTLLIKRVMPWLVSEGVTARGAKCALVDHPVPAVRQELHRWLTRDPGATTATTSSAYLDRLRATYEDPDLAWGDSAVPDDTTWIAEALRLLAVDTETRKHGLPVLDVALALGRSEAEVRELVKPQKRSGGFTRPCYLAYANKAKTHVKAIGCPHGRCKGRRFASHVVLLPEVAASGYGVVCIHCRRTPATHEAWPRTQFPTTYLESWTNRGPGGSLRTEAQTVPTSRPA